MQPGQLLHILDGFHAARLLVMGDVMLDRFVYGSVERISPEAPIPVVNVERCVDMPGGAANVGRNAAALGAQVRLLGVVGADPAATDLRAQLEGNAGIRSHLICDSTRPTTAKTRYVADGQQVMRADRESRAAVAQAIGAQLLDVVSQVLPEVDVLVLSDYAKGVLTDFTVRGAIDAARAAGKTVIVDPKDRDFTRYRGATILTPNRAELQRACGEDCNSDEQVVAGARRIMARGVCEYLVVTRGKDGISVIGPQDLAVHLSTTARQVFDVSGAGDTVIAALALALAAGASVIEAATLANLAAGVVVGKRGTATTTTGEIIAAAPPAGLGESHKLFSLDNVLQQARSWREQGLKLAFTNGCFDLLHPGHISLLNQARACADRLIVGLNADSSVRQLKGPNRPVQSEIARATVLAAVKAVDAVVIFAQPTPLELIDALRPDVLVKGSDYRLENVVGADLVLSRGGRVELAALLDGHSTTRTVSKVALASGG